MDLLLVLIVVFGLLFDYTNGFHDAANVVSTVIATRALRPMIAITLAAILNAVGATQISGVAQTISSGLVDPLNTTQLAVVCALIGAILWNFLTWYFGIPSSSSYALIGGILGSTFAHAGNGAILWHGVIGKVLIPMVFSPLIGFGLAYLLMKILYLVISHEKRSQKTFRYIQIFSSCIMSLSHGLNDAQKSMGIITLGLFASGLLMTTTIPIWVIFACALTMGLGTASGGFRIIKTVGFQITKIEPMQGFASDISSSCVILAASSMGMPLSSTHIIVGSITGIGSAKGAKHVRWKIAKKLIAAWVLTLPGAGLVSYGAFKILTHFLHR